VFEEHLICENELESFELSARPGTSVYSKRDDAFSFGAVLANLFGLPGGKDSGEGTETSEPTAETDGNDGGTSAPQAASTVTPKNGTSARFKISNNKKVKCVVDVSLTPIDREQGGGGATAEHPPMSLAETSKLLEIPPHEHRFVTVFFAPAAIAKFAATLRAVVRDGSDDKTRELRCELRGEGALPHVTVETPAFVDEATSSPTVTFPMTPLGSVSQKRQITLRNDGVLPAFCRLDYALKTAESHNKRSPITVIGAGVTTEIAPGKYLPFTTFRRLNAHTRLTLSFLSLGTAKVLDVTYEPREEGDDSLQVVLAVKSNAFETRTIHIQGSGYVPDVLFENLNHSFPGSLKFNDGPVGSRMVETFTLSNASRKNWRFEFPDFGDSQKNENETSKAFQFTPRVGHLPAGTSTTITATFLSRSETLLGVDSENPPLEVPVKLVPVKSYFEGAHLEYLEKR
jgi:hydrocephalus-inducing protein